MRPYRTCEASSSPLTSLSRTAAHDASLLGTILIPYFSSNFMTEAMTTDAQSVRGMKPTFTSFFSGASDPAAHAACRTPGATIASNAAPLPIVISLLRSRSGRAGADLAQPDCLPRVPFFGPDRLPACFGTFIASVRSREDHKKSALSSEQKIERQGAVAHCSSLHWPPQTYWSRRSRNRDLL